MITALPPPRFRPGDRVLVGHAARQAQHVVRPRRRSCTATCACRRSAGPSTVLWMAMMARRLNVRVGAEDDALVAHGGELAEDVHAGFLRNGSGKGARHCASSIAATISAPPVASAAVQRSTPRAIEASTAKTACRRQDDAGPDRGQAGLREELAGDMGHERVLFCSNPDVGLKAIIAVHSTVLGPGARRRADVALRAATDEALDRRAPPLARHDLQGRRGRPRTWAAARRSSSATPRRTRARRCSAPSAASSSRSAASTSPPRTSAPTWRTWRSSVTETRWVTGVSPAHRRRRRSVAVTAFGVLQGIKAAVKRQLAATTRSSGRTVAVQGLGNVGYHLAQLPAARRAPRSSAPTSTPRRVARAASELGVEIVPPGRDPRRRVRRLRALRARRRAQRPDASRSCAARSSPAPPTTSSPTRPATARRSHERGILYAPDYVINAGGLINVYNELDGYNRERAMRMARGIYANSPRVFEIARANASPPTWPPTAWPRSASPPCARRARSIGTDGCANCASLGVQFYRQSAGGLMSQNQILDLLGSQLDAATLRRMSSQVGATPQQTAAAVETALPVLLGALQRNASTPGGSHDLLGALDRDHDGSILDDLAGFLGQGPSRSDARSLDHIFGDRRPTVENAVSRRSGLDSAQVMKLLAMLAPIILGALNRVRPSRRRAAARRRDRGHPRRCGGPDAAAQARPRRTPRRPPRPRRRRLDDRRSARAGSGRRLGAARPATSGQR